MHANTTADALYAPRLNDVKSPISSCFACGSEY